MIASLYCLHVVFIESNYLTLDLKLLYTMLHPSDIYKAMLAKNEKYSVKHPLYTNPVTYERDKSLSDFLVWALIHFLN